MRFTLKQLIVFEAVARLGSVTKASEEVALSQSATSMALSELEAGLKVRLFNRNGKRLTLNIDGNRLMTRARALLNQAGEIEQIGFAGPESIGGPLRVMASETIADMYLPGLCAAFLAEYPKVQLSVGVGHSPAEVMDSITHAASDIAFVESPCNRSGISIESIGIDHLQIFAAAGHPLSLKKEVDLDELLEERWVLREPNGWFRTQLLLALGHRHGTLQIALESSSNRFIRTAVAANVGLSCLPYAHIKEDIEAGRVSLVPTTVDLRRSLQMLIPDNLRVSCVAAAFAHFARERFSKFAAWGLFEPERDAGQARVAAEHWNKRRASECTEGGEYHELPELNLAS